MTNLENLAIFAKACGYFVTKVGDKVLVWDHDGLILTNNINELKIWMGY